MGMKRPWIVYKRSQSGSGGYSAGFLDPSTGLYKRRISLRDENGKPIRSLALAEEKARAMAMTSVPASSTATFQDYLTAFWADGGEYVQSRAARGHVLSRSYLHNMRNNLSKHVKPYLDRKYPGLLLSGVTPAAIEGLLMELHRKGALSARAINAVLGTLRVALAEAQRLGLLTSNPAQSIERMAVSRVVREILTPEEVRAFFALAWEDERYRVVNLLSATTGLRIGECVGLLHEDVRAGYLHVCHNWQEGEGLKAPKWGSARDVPLPSRTEEAVRSLMGRNPWSGTFVFWGRAAGAPLSKHSVENSYNFALAQLGIAGVERKRRGLTFHAWRHFFNAMLRGRIADHVLRGLTGHHTEAMTEHYSHITEEQRREVARLADGIILT